MFRKVFSSWTHRVGVRLRASAEAVREAAAAGAARSQPSRSLAAVHRQARLALHPALYLLLVPAAAGWLDLSSPSSSSSSSSSSLVAFCQSYEDTDVHESRRNLPLSRNFVADVVDAVSPAVVNIVCTASGYGQPASSGSGFIISRDGFIATNAHVVTNAAGEGVIVTMNNGIKRRAVVYAVDTLSDIAVLKLEDLGNEPLPVAPLGESAKVRSGEFVIAIGSPMMLQNSASLGIISATARHASELGLSNNRSEFLQTDAAVNVGNSGGPLVNLDGSVIGINTLKVRGTDGISLAIPIDVASIIIKQLIAFRKVTRPYVGLKMAEVILTDDNSVQRKHRRNGRLATPILAQTKVMVLEVQPHSPAASSGLVR